MWRFKVWVIQLNWYPVVYSLEKRIFVSANRDGFEFGGGGDDFEKTLELRPFFEREGVDLNSNI